MSKVKELNDIVIFGCRMGVGIDKALEDKKMTVADMAYFISPLMSAGDAFENAKDALEEVKKIDAEGIKKLEGTIEVELKISNVKAKKIVKKVIVAAMGIYMSYRDISLLIKEDVAA